jgi:hypothetical protein
VELAVPLNVGFFNPDLVQQVQLGPLMQGIGSEPQYKNDEQIDNQLRSVLFQVPVSGNPECLDGPTLPECFNGVVDLRAIDIQRGRDHGMPSYNQMRNAFGLSSKTSFTSVTGESTESFPSDPLLTPGYEINDPNSLDVIALFDADGNPTTVEADNAVRMVRRTTLAARLKAIFGSVSNMDAFTGMLAERHLSNSELGELQRAIWRDQFTRAREGDRFFYLNDPLQSFIRQNFGIDYRRTLAQVIAANTDIPVRDLEANVFFAPTEEGALGAQARGERDRARRGDEHRSPAAQEVTAPSTLTRHKGTRVGSGGRGDAVSMNSGPRTLGRRGRRRCNEPQ